MSLTQSETELAFYARLEDPESLKEAEIIEDHIQVESTLISGTRIRVRKITPIKGGPVEGAARYEITLKIKGEPIGGVPSSMETTQETDKEFYAQFCQVAHRAIVKRRYTFAGTVPVVAGAEGVVIPAVKYEVDQFTNPNTREPSEWIKVDIELDGVLKALTDAGIDTAGVRQRFDLTKLPFVADDMFTSAGANPEQKAKLGDLWENEFSQKLAPDEYVPINGEQHGPSPVVKEVDQATVTQDEATQQQTEPPSTEAGISAV